MKQEDDEKYTLRISRFGFDIVANNVTILELIDRLLDLPIPRTLCYDLSEENMTGNAYILQPRLNGTKLTFLYGSLNLEQEKSIVRQVTQLTTQLATITSDRLGVASSSNHHTNSKTNLWKLQVPRCGKKGTGFDKPRTWAAEKQTPLELLLDQCKRWRDFQAATTGANFEEIWDSLEEVARGLQEHGYLDTDNLHLCHGDLQPYNLLAQIRNEENVENAAIFD